MPPSSGSVIRYEGPRGVTWRIKYRDAAGKQCMETVGKEPAVRRRDAEAALRSKLVDVKEERWRKPPPLTFAAAISEWFDAMAVEKAWRQSSVKVYRVVVARLCETFGRMPLTHVEAADIVAYKTNQLAVYGPSTVSRDLSTLHA